jgi:hypothetical protein
LGTFRAAGSGRGLTVAHEDANHVVACRLEQMGRDAAVDASGHGQNDPRHVLLVS